MHVKDLASVAGKVISMEAGVGQVCRLKTLGQCTSVFLSRSSWKGKVLVTKDVIEEVKCWLNNAVPLNGRKLTHRTSEYTRVVYSDASDIGFGAYIENVSGTDVISTWSEQESVQSSTWRELMAVSRSIDMLKGHLNSQCVKWYTDNKNVTHILEVGSRKPYLHRIALDILEKCDKLHITL